MRWMRDRAPAGPERGAAAVTFALALIPLLVVLAFVVDAGLLYWEKSQLQNGADAAALAVAEQCIRTNGACTGSADGVATAIAGDNANDGATTALNNGTLVVSGASGSVEVTASSPSGNGVAHPFASLLGLVPDTTLVATASTEWGNPISGGTLPLAIASCELKQIETDPAAAKQIFLRSDNKGQDCPGSYPGGFGWLDDGDGNCWVTIDVNGYVQGTTGNNPGKTGCSASDFTGLLGKTVLVPIYDGFTGPPGDKEKGGSHGTYHISKFAAFKVTGYKTSGSDDTYIGSSSPSFKGSKAGDCDSGGSCRGLRGYFVRYVELGDDFDLGTAPDGGLTVVRFTG